MEIGKIIREVPEQIPFKPSEYPLFVPVPCPEWPSRGEEGEEPIPVELPAKVPVEPSDACPPASCL